MAKTFKTTHKAKAKVVSNAAPKKAGAKVAFSPKRVGTTKCPQCGKITQLRGQTVCKPCEREAQAALLPTHAPHGIVRARAGTGKTFTLVLGVANMFREEQYPRGSTGTLWGKVEKALGFKVQASAQQQEVWDFMAWQHDANGEMDKLHAPPRPRSVCYVAFNSSIVEEFSEKYDWLVKALEAIGVKLTFSTVHSLGLAACRQAYKLHGWKQVNQYRVSDLLSALWQKDLREVWKEKAETIQAIQELVGLCKLTLRHPADEDDEDLEMLAAHYGILVNGNKEEVFTAVRHILSKCREMEKGDRPDFNDMIWLPVVNNLPMPEVYDLVIGDEAQDWNRCQQEIILKVSKRLILVGDDRQAIYGFAGADTDSIDRMQTLLGGVNTELSTSKVVQLRLTQTRRCGKAIVEKAKTLVPDFEAHASNPQGRVSQCQMEELEAEPEGLASQDASNEGVQRAAPHSLGESDMVLCRVNAPLVGLAFRMLKAGKRVNIKGRDIGTGLKAFIKKSKEKEVGSFLAWLDLFYEKEAERIKRRRNVDTEALVTLEDKCRCLRTLCEGAFTMKGVYDNIDKLFQGKVCPNCGKNYDEHVKACYACKEDRGRHDGQDGRGVALVKPKGTLLSSVHRAKGMEAKRVFILRPDLMPHPKARSAWEKGQEANLQYVAWTRAIEELVFVSEGDSSRSGGNGSNGSEGKGGEA